jgi:predicted lipid carrier protein YhbT
MDSTTPFPPGFWLRWLPHPARLVPLLSILPPVLLRQLGERLAEAVLRVASDWRTELTAFEGTPIAIEIIDLRHRLVLEFAEGGIRLRDAAMPALATVRGGITDLLLLVSRQEDADTLFFQRRLTLIGDVETGLRLRNVLDQLPWEQLPLGLRIVLHRGARLAARARDAHRAQTRAAWPLRPEHAVSHTPAARAEAASQPATAAEAP